MAFPPGFLDELRARVPVSEVVARSVKLVKRGREHEGLCPFHNEKTPSFTVNDDKAFYHCFGCGAHGDVIKFLMENQGLGFLEAVEQLAGEAGLEMPERSPRDLEKEQQSRRLTDLMEDAATWFQARLRDESGRAALGYVQKRALTTQTLSAFALGYGPDGRQRLRQAMTAKGWRDSDLIEAGLVILPEGGNEPYDRFRGRLMFPIRDAKGRCIAFGGRALSADAKAKYLNSPETSLFHKGRTLYNIDKARKAAYDSGQLIVAEGYMDVIALVQAGFSAAVAPLGTALTEDQITLLWRMVDEPILCFDGDRAGRKAAQRGLERALPLLKPGKSLRFAMLPQGKDPDDLIQAEGKGAMAAVLEASQPLSALLWDTLVESGDTSTPERRAAMQKSAMDIAGTIEDQSVRSFYQSDLRARLKTLFYGDRNTGFSASSRRPGGGRAWAPPPKASSFLKSSPLAQSDSVTNVGEIIVLTTILNHPSLVVSHLETLANLNCARKDIHSALESVLDAAPTLEGLDSQTQKNTLRECMPTRLVSEVDRDIFVRSLSFTRPGAELWQAEAGLTHTLSMLRRVTDLEEECRVAELEAEKGDMRALERWKGLRAQLAQHNKDLSNFDRGLENGLAGQ
ncbi:MAG: DNA primase [Pseudomonadota bacterium]